MKSKSSKTIKTVTTDIDLLEQNDELYRKILLTVPDVIIKTDIEGAEPFALRGAEETLRKFKPKLAISIYHSMDDFVNIVKQINELNLGYQFYLGHYTIFGSETILFCTIGQKS